MTNRLNYAQHAPRFINKLLEFVPLFAESTLDRSLIDFVNIRASQINGCAFCLDMHVKEAKIHGERDLRLYHIPIWNESPLFTDKEKAAFEWTEAVTTLNGKSVPEDIYQRVRAHFSEKELSELTFAVAFINVFNRLNASFGKTPGSMDEMLGLTKAGLK
jgi:AhpD family alkylhydroperoxidase